jgi:ABC-type transport system involved in multi-copper enzyme maturation permease subunit
MAQTLQQHSPPSDLRNLLIIAKFELVRLFLTPRGLVALVTFAIIWYFLLRYPINLAADVVLSADFSEAISEKFGEVGLANLLEWQVPEMVVYWVVALYIFPLFAILITADQTCSDRSRGTLRFLSLRTSRDSIFFGRFIGQMLILAILIVATLVGAILLAVWKNSYVLNDALQVSLLIGINLFIVLLPFTALMALISATVRSARLSIMLAIISWGLLTGLTAWLAFKYPAVEFIQGWLPGGQRSDLVKSNGWESLNYSILPLVQMVIFLLAGRYIMRRSSL